MPQESKTVVVDASIVLKWQLDDEEHVPQATALRNDFYKQGIIQAIAPHLLVYEIANGIVTATKLKRITIDTAIEAISNLMALGIELKEIEPRRVLKLALKYDLTAYDAAYLALSESENCELWTGDESFYQAVQNAPFLMRWLGDYVASHD